MGLALYPVNALERMHVQVRLGQQLLELGVLAFELTQPLRVGRIHSAKLGSQLVEGGTAEAALAAQLLERQSSLGPLEKADYLLLGESAFLDVRHSPG